MPGTGAHLKNHVIPEGVTILFWIMVILTALFTGLIFIIRLDTYQFYSNFFEVVIALVCMVSCLYAYRTWSGRIILLLAAFAFGGFALSNTFWYLYSIASHLGRQDVFFTISELGFLGFMLFFIVVFRIEFPPKPCPLLLRITMAGLLLIIALMVIGTLGLDRNTALFMFRFLVVALLIDVALYHEVYQYALLWPGICLWSFASILYGLRDTLFIMHKEWLIVAPFTGTPLSVYDFLSVVGSLDILALLFIQLGLFKYLNSRQD
jgi:hypothetical protein